MKYCDGSRNFGWGKTLRYAGIQALKFEASLSGGRYAWLAANKNRWDRFCKFANARGVNDGRYVDKNLVEQYVKTLSKLSVSTQQNYISSVNVVMKSMAGSTWESVSPKGVVGFSRSAVRTKPILFTESNVIESSEALRDSGHISLSYVPVLAFYLGLRRKECCLMDVRLALYQASMCGYVDVRRGTKGGRGKNLRRAVPANNVIVGILRRIMSDLGRDSRCIIPKSTSYKKYNSDISSTVLPVLKKYGIKKIHDLRVAYACNRYWDITGYDAPCNQVGKTQVTLMADEHARQLITQELGHGRIQIISSYVGAKPRHLGREDE